MSLATRFSRSDSVDVWDAYFRWRDGPQLRDVTIDDTWWRVATAAAKGDGAEAPLWAQRFVDSFSRWRMLPGENLLRTLGTHGELVAGGSLGAVLNIAAFVSRPAPTRSVFHRDTLVETASLAVRFLDDVAASCVVERPMRLRIGIIGLADALEALGLEYDSVDGRCQAAQAAQAMAEGCLRSSVELAMERGSRLSSEDCRACADRLRHRGMPGTLVEQALHGLRYVSLTAIDSHPALARLANGVADGVADGIEKPKPMHVGGFASGRILGAELEMRAIIQPWIDEPMDKLHRPAAAATDPASIPTAGNGGEP